MQGGSTSTFLSLSVDTEGERGLLGLAVDSGYADPASPGHRRFFADYISGRIWSAPANAVPASIADATELTALLDAGQAGALSRIASFGSGASGELFPVDYVNGKVVQVVPEPALVWLWLLGLAAVGTRQRWMRTMRPAMLSVSR